MTSPFPRQISQSITTQTGTSSPSPSQSHAASQSRILVPAIVVPVVLSTVLLIAIIYSLRYKIKRNSTSSQTSSPLPSSHNISQTTTRTSTSTEGQRQDSQPLPLHRRVALLLTRSDLFGSLLASRQASNSTSSSSGGGTADSSRDNVGRENSARRNGERRERRQRDGVRRTDSGHSVKTLPEYRLSVGDDEMILYKGVTPVSVQDLSLGGMEGSNGGLALQRLDSSQSEEANDVPLLSSPVDRPRSQRGWEGEDPGEEREDLRDFPTTATRRSSTRRSVLGVAESLSNSVRRSMRIVGGGAYNTTHEGNEMDEIGRLESAHNPERRRESYATPEYSSLYPAAAPPHIQIEEGSHDTPSPYGAITSEEDEHRSATEEPPPNRHLVAFRSLFRSPGGAHQSSASTSMVNPTNGSGQSPGHTRHSSTPTHHRRFGSSASIMSTLTPSEYDSNLSLSLHPTRSSLTPSRLGRPSLNRPRSQSGTPGRLFDGNSSHNSLLHHDSWLSQDDSPTPSFSNTPPSLNDGRRISGPLQGSLLRMQYEAPARGLTESQMSFLASVESLGRFGVPVRDGGEEEKRLGEGSAANPPPTYAPEQRGSNNSVEALERDVRATRPAPLLTNAEVAARDVVRQQDLCHQSPTSPNNVRNEERIQKATTITTTNDSSSSPAAVSSVPSSSAL